MKYGVGDSVYVSTSNLRAYGGKLVPKWVGPYLVTEVLSSGVNVRLDLRGELGKAHDVFHVSRLKRYEESELEWPGRQNRHPPAPELVDGETEWVVEQVVGKEIKWEDDVKEVVEEQPVSARGGRVLRQRPPRVRQVKDEGASSVLRTEVAGMGGHHAAESRPVSLPGSDRRVRAAGEAEAGREGGG